MGPAASVGSLTTGFKCSRLDWAGRWRRRWELLGGHAPRGPAQPPAAVPSVPSSWAELEVVAPTACPPEGTAPAVVAVVGATVVVSAVVAELGTAEIEVPAPPPARVVVADGAEVVAACEPPSAGAAVVLVVVVLSAVVGTGTTGVGPRPVHTVVVVVAGTLARVVEVLVRGRVGGGRVVVVA